MKKYLIFSLLCTTLVIASCSDAESYADKVEKEQKLIDAYLAELKKDGYSVKQGFPADGQFDPKIYYRHAETGVYMNIIDYGDTTKMASQEDGTRVYYRMDSYWFMTDSAAEDWAWLNPIGYSDPPAPIVYGQSSTYTATSPDKDYYLRSPAAMLALKYVGLYGRVNMIIPFRYYYGSYYQVYTLMCPLTVNGLTFTKFY